MKKILILLLTLVPFVMHSQEDGVSYWQQYWEEWAEQNEMETLPDDLIEVVESFRETPFNINDTSSERLLLLPFVSPFQWECIKAYIMQNGEMFSVNELAFVNGIDTITLRLLKEVVVALPVERGRAFSLKQMFTQGGNNLVMGTRRQIELSRGYRDTVYQGDPYRFYFRYYYHYQDHLRLQLSGEKDPGEPWLGPNGKKGLDHLGGYLLLKDMGRLKQLAIGHYHLHFGQGLTLWSGFMPWNISSANQMLYAQGITGAGAMTEYGFFQGVSTRIAVTKRLDLSLFLSHRNLDATPSKEDSMAVQSIYNSGYHRTETELSKRNLLGETVYGANLRWHHTSFSLGMTGYMSHYSRRILPASSRYNHYYYAGNENAVVGVDGSCRRGNLFLYSEVSLSHNPYGKILYVESGEPPLAGVVGLQYHIQNNAFAGISARFRNASYQNLHNVGYWQSGSAPDERAVRTTFQTMLPGSIRLNTSVDFYANPLSRYGVYAPSKGSDFRAALSRSWGKKLDVSLHYRYKDAATNASLSNIDSTLFQWFPLDQANVYVVEQRLRQQLQFRCDYTPTHWISFATRAVMTQVSCDYHFSQNGWMISQDISLNGRDRLQCAMRYMYFNASGYDARIYSVESDLLYENAAPALQGKGHRCYLLLRWLPHDSFSLSVKYGVTAYQDRDEVGTGYDMTQGPFRQDVKVQMRFKIRPPKSFSNK